MPVWDGVDVDVCVSEDVPEEDELAVRVAVSDEEGEMDAPVDQDAEAVSVGVNVGDCVGDDESVRVGVARYGGATA